MVVALVLSTIATLSAQNSASTTHSPDFSENSDATVAKDKPTFMEGSSLVSPSVRQAVARARRALSEEKAGSSTQETNSQSAESMVDLNIRRKATSSRKVAVGTGSQPYEIEANSLETGLVQMTAVHRESSKPAENAEGSDCKAVSLSVEQRIKSDVSRVLEIVESEVGANPSCACEIVKMAITASDPDVAKVVSIVETAINAAPESMRIISQCAIATAPDSIAQVQALLAELDPNTGDGDGDSAKSAKSAKSGKDAEVASMVAPPIENPLDRPYFPSCIPTVIIPPHVTNVNPGGHRH
jgi:hypothetical protein